MTNDLGTAPAPRSELPAARVVQAPFSSALLELAARRPEIVVLSADLSKYTDVAPFAAAHPDRFFQVGMAEQNMMGIAGGLAKTGFLPIPVTYCVFAARRALDQVEMALATGRRTTVVTAFLPGITTPFRASHQGTDDLAAMRGIPGMTVIDPMDATELAAALRAAVEVEGPVYLRGLRGEVEAILETPYELDLAHARLLRDGNDIGLVGTGLGTCWALEASLLLAEEGVSAAVLHVPVLKPFDTAGVASFAGRFAALLS
ncbi:MAG TPA: transketolase C-terminal domain-containing protein, partial [Acidimicrobiales bacterium]|nr:transketolase C-terminal domain-containing protein [Acidimicrobiales bacterium]